VCLLLLEVDGLTRRHLFAALGLAHITPGVVDVWHLAFVHRCHPRLHQLHLCHVCVSACVCVCVCVHAYVRTYIHVHIHMHTHTHTHTHTCTHARSLSLSLSLSHTHTHNRHQHKTGHTPGLDGLGVGSRHDFGPQVLHLLHELAPQRRVLARVERLQQLFVLYWPNLCVWCVCVCVCVCRRSRFWKNVSSYKIIKNF
jgi:hypothetical protein